MINSHELLQALVKKIPTSITQRDRLWWPHSGEFEVILGTILTQQTKWQNVMTSLDNLRLIGALKFEGFLTLDIETIKFAIKPSGFYNQKAVRLYNLVHNISKEFGTLAEFKEQASKEWLLAQKGIGFESADSILCYFAYQDVMVVDNYTKKLMGYFGYEFESYDEMASWFEAGVNENYDKICQLLGEKKPLYEIYALYHGYIVEFCKSGCKNIQELGIQA